jgi:hypothetical protein
MAAPKTMHGARALVSVNGKVVGIFNSLSYDYTLDLQPINILGRFSPAELVHTGAEPVTVRASGWRVVGQGPHVVASVPQIQELLTTGYIEFTVLDRTTNQRVAKIHSVKSTGYATSFTAKTAQEVTFNYVGLMVDDESTQMSEAPGASDLPA